MKKKITGILLCFMFLCMSLLTGCSLVERDYNSFYSQVVATVENKETGKQGFITKKDLLQNYQNSYSSSTGSEEDVNRVLGDLIDYKIKLLSAEEKFGIDEDGNGLSEKEKTYLYQQTLDAMKSNLDRYYNELVTSSDNSNNSSSSSVKFNGYNKNANLKITQLDGGDELYDVVNEGKEQEINEEFDSFTYTVARSFYNNNDRKKLYQFFMDFLTNDNYSRSFERYYRDLRLSEYGMEETSDAESVFTREIERVYKIIYQDFMFKKLDYESKKSETELDASSSITASQIVGLYSSKARASYTQYVLEDDSAYDSNMQSTIDKMYYIKTDDVSTKFFKVVNILFKFTDEQQKKYDEYKAKYDKKDGRYSYNEYQEDLDALYNQVTPVVRQYNPKTDEYEGGKQKTTKEDVNAITIEKVLEEIQNTMQTAKQMGDVNYLGDTLNEFIYKYNEDTGMFNADNNYVIGVDSDGKAVSSFVESFNDAGIALYNGGHGEIGDVSGLVRTNYGIHVLVYTGQCTNLFDGIDASFELNEEGIKTLYETRVNICLNQTYFDVLYDEISQKLSSDFNSKNMNFLKEKFNITTYSTRYGDMIDNEN